MHDFDDIFKNKLNDEQPFVNQNRSWSKLNRDLHVYELGVGLASKTLILWKVLGIVAVLSTSALLWERYQLAKEIRSLKSTVERLE